MKYLDNDGALLRCEDYDRRMELLTEQGWVVYQGDREMALIDASVITPAEAKKIAREQGYEFG